MIVYVVLRIEMCKVSQVIKTHVNKILASILVNKVK